MVSRVSVVRLGVKFIKGRRTGPQIVAGSAAAACGWTAPPGIDQKIQTDVCEDAYAAA